jgi:Zn-dependent M16 (insulinase) family peptidase
MELYQENNIYHGFRLRERRFIKEFNANCLYFSHIKSGARLLKVMADDPNKTFAITFKTVPGSDNGAPHILEHSVLNGSRSFPVKSPFDVLLKGSLSTFLNAFTSKDFTMYPVASVNEKDYFNLMHVYLDAVFRPLIHEDSRILRQEGWHIECTSVNEPLKFTGVVYNEMKGAFSNPQRELWYHAFRHLFPDSIYGHESGGTPEAITTLTEEQFLAFHNTFYHPENSYIFLYGDADPDAELSFINRNYLQEFTLRGNNVMIAGQPLFKAPRTVTEYYQSMEGEDAANQSFLSFNFLAGLNTDLSLTFALDILCEILVNQESAPIRLALAEAGIGQEVSAYSSNFLQHAVQIVAMNANPEDLDTFLAVLKEAFQRVVDHGIDLREVEGIINRTDFRLREGEDAQKGLSCLNMALPGWFFADDPFMGLEYAKILEDMRKSVKDGYLESLVKQYFLDNPHRVVLTLKPSSTLEKDRTEATERQLEAIRNSLSAGQLERLEQETKDLIEYQQREESAEALASVPMLSLADISRQSVCYQAVAQDAEGIPLLTYPQFTNNIVYLNLLFDLQTVPQELLPWLNFFCALPGSMNTTGYSFSELNKLLNIHTGGFSVMPRIWLEGADENRMIPKLAVQAKAIGKETNRMFELVGEIVRNTNYRDRERIRTLLKRHHSHLESHMKGNGFQAAGKRLGARLSRHGAFRELTSGLTHYRFITDMVKNFDAQQDQIIGQLEQIARILFTRQNLMVACSADETDLREIPGQISAFAGTLNNTVPVSFPWNFEIPSTREAICAASNVQYIVKGFNYKKLGYEWNGRMRVLNQILSTDWLQNKIRVIGGAYGGFSSITQGGHFLLNSYRDPNLEATLSTFDETAAYLEKFSADEMSMTRYIIGTISGMDTPLTPVQRADQAFYLHITGKTKEEIQKEREEVLATTRADIRAFAPLAREIREKGVYCVYGNADLLKRNSTLFEEMTDI